MNPLFFLPLLPKLEQAACKEFAFPNLFFPVGKKQEAKSLPLTQLICGGCIEREECLEFALEQQIPHGIWAGTTPEMRKSMTATPKGPAMTATNADRIRELTDKGKSPKQIAVMLSVDVSYVKLALTRTAKNKGEIQLLNTTENSLDDSSSSSVSA